MTHADLIATVQSLLNFDKNTLVVLGYCAYYFIVFDGPNHKSRKHARCRHR